MTTTTRTSRPNTSGTRGGLYGRRPLGLPGEEYSRDEEQQFRSQLADAMKSLQRQLATQSARIVYGSFTMAAAATKTVADANVLSTSRIHLMETNAAAGILQGSAKHLYVSARTEGVSFVVSTASGAAAAGTETFEYVILN